MRTENKGPGKNGQQVRHNVFQRMAIDGREGNRGSPFVMLLVNVLVYLVQELNFITEIVFLIVLHVVISPSYGATSSASKRNQSPR